MFRSLRIVSQNSPPFLASYGLLKSERKGTISQPWQLGAAHGLDPNKQNLHCALEVLSQGLRLNPAPQPKD